MDSRHHRQGGLVARRRVGAGFSAEAARIQVNLHLLLSAPTSLELLQGAEHPGS